MKVTALIREWVEQQVAAPSDDTRVVPVAELQRLIARSARPAGAPRAVAPPSER